MIHILTLTYNGVDKLKRLRPGLLRNLEKSGQDWEWLIRINGDNKDGTVEEINSWNDSKVKILNAAHNRSNFAEGMNSLAWFALGPLYNCRSVLKSIRQPSKDLLLLLNDDIEFFDDDSLSKMGHLMEDENIGIVGCRLLYSGTNLLQHAGVIFSDKYGRMPYHYRHKEESDATAEKNKYFQAVTAAVCLVRFNDFLCADGMNDKLHWAFEDIDLNLKIGKLGKKIAYCGGTKIYHEESATLKKTSLNKLFLNPNVTYFKQQWFGKYEIDHDKYLKDSNYNDIK